MVAGLGCPSAVKCRKKWRRVGCPLRHTLTQAPVGKLANVLDHMNEKETKRVDRERETGSSLGKP